MILILSFMFIQTKLDKTIIGSLKMNATTQLHTTQ